MKIYLLICEQDTDAAWGSTVKPFLSQEDARAAMKKDFYDEVVAVYADRMANKTVTDEEIAKILDEMFPVDDDMSDREKRNAEKAREEYMICWFAPDIAKFINTAWGALNAMSDMVGHTAPRRQTANYQENNWGRIMDGHAMLDKFAGLLAGAGTR